MTNQHRQKVRSVQLQVRRFYRSGVKVKIYHGSTNSLRKQSFSAARMVDVSSLNAVLRVDAKNRLAISEPNVSMRQLVKATLKFGLIPAVVMEFPNITVGGGIQGGAAESTAFKYGGFHDTCTEYEVVLADGSLTTASKHQNARLFREIACSYGTIGIITKATIKLIPAQKYVALRYERVNSFEQARGVLFAGTRSKDFIDGIMFSPDMGVVMSGKLTEGRNLPISRFSRFFDEWFYLHAERIVKQSEFYEELVPLEDYLFRYDKGAFWMGRYSFKLLHIPFNRLSRSICSPFSNTKFLYRQLHAANMSQRFVVQDLCMPESTVCKFIQFVDSEIGAYPLWLLPISSKASTNSLFSPVHSKSSDRLLNVGVWTESVDYQQFLEKNRMIERQVKALGGRKTLYAHSYYTENEFWQIYDKHGYDKVRKKYQADRVFPDIYSKVVVKERYTPSIAKAVLSLPNLKLPVANSQKATD